MWNVYDRELFMLLVVTTLLWTQYSQSGNKNTEVHPKGLYSKTIKKLNEDYFGYYVFTFYALKSQILFYELS